MMICGMKTTWQSAFHTDDFWRNQRTQIIYTPRGQSFFLYCSISRVESFTLIFALRIDTKHVVSIKSDNIGTIRPKEEEKKS